jgi:hypothetical protein
MRLAERDGFIVAVASVVGVSDVHEVDVVSGRSPEVESVDIEASFSSVPANASIHDLYQKTSA